MANIQLFRETYADGHQVVSMMDMDTYDKIVAYAKQQGMVHIEPTRLTREEAKKLARPISRMLHIVCDECPV